MSLDLYEKEISEKVSSLGLTTMPETSAWDGFARGTAQSAMQTFAKAGRAASMGVGGIVSIGAGTELQDSYFRWHDDTFGDAVDFWTPKPGEVGVAGQITGQLLATLPLLIASPTATIAATELGVAEDLARKGVDSDKAVATGVVQGAGLALGIYVPILGQTLSQRVLLGGAGFNLFQGVTTRAASELILEGSAAAADYQAFDPTALTLDVLMGAMFGGVAHLSPTMRAQGAEFLKGLENVEPSKRDAVMVMRQAQHINADSLPGKPTSPQDVTAHVERTRQALDQLARDQRVDVSDVPEGRYEIDEPRIQEMAQRADELVRVADDVRKNEGLPEFRETEAPPAPRGAEPPPPRSDEGRPGGESAKGEAPDPAVLEAKRFADERGDVEITVGRDVDGQPTKMKVKDFLAESDEAVKLANDDAKLFEVAARCMLGN